ncbi:MAG: hypothetical protein ACRD2Z_16935 [Thermoanaerobaculia bacterium]
MYHRHHPGLQVGPLCGGDHELPNYLPAGPAELAEELSVVTPVGVLRRVEVPTFEQRVVGQIQSVIDERGQGSLEELLYSGDLWTVREDGTVSRTGS